MYQFYHCGCAVVHSDVLLPDKWQCVNGVIAASWAVRVLCDYYCGSAAVHSDGCTPAGQVWQFLELHQKILCSSLGILWSTSTMESRVSAHSFCLWTLCFMSVHSTVIECSFGLWTLCFMSVHSTVIECSAGMGCWMLYFNSLFHLSMLVCK